MINMINLNKQIENEVFVLKTRVVSITKQGDRDELKMLKSALKNSLSYIHDIYSITFKCKRENHEERTHKILGDSYICNKCYLYIVENGFLVVIDKYKEVKIEN